MDPVAARPTLHVAVPPGRFFGYYPGTVAVITSSFEGVRNVMAAGWHAALSAEPPLYGVALGRTRHTYDLVRASGAFAVHFLAFEKADVIAGVGSTSGREVDKFARFDLATTPGAVLDVPVLGDAYLAYECRVEAIHPTGDHDFVVGEVVALHHREDAYDERRLVDTEHVRPAVFYGRGEFEALGTGERATHRRR
jgi:flavin reductase (DIM6/NTAB) family NADH-FMN oxidoreductase RutF